MDLRYKQDGAPRNTTYTVKSYYVSAIKLIVEIASMLFVPDVAAEDLTDSLLDWGIVKVVTGGLELVGTCTLAALAQNEYFYAYIPLQAPDQPEVYKTFTGTNYRITETNHRFEGKKYFDGYASNGWGTTALGVNLGNNFFNSYCTVARWVK